MEPDWVEQEGSPSKLDGSGLNAVQCKVKPGRFACCVSSSYSFSFFPAAAGTMSRVLARTAWETGLMLGDRKSHCNTVMGQSREKYEMPDIVPD